MDWFLYDNGHRHERVKWKVIPLKKIHVSFLEQVQKDYRNRLERSNSLLEKTKEAHEKR